MIVICYSHESESQTGLFSLKSKVGGKSSHRIDLDVSHLL